MHSSHFNRAGLAVALLILVCCASGADGQEIPCLSNGSITGRVLLASGRPANVNIKLTLRNELQPLIALTTTSTDKNGEFRLLNLPKSVYFVDADGDPGYFESVTTRVDIPCGRHASITVYLRAKKETPSARKAEAVSAAELGQRVPEPARSEYEKATKLIKKGDTPQAIEHLKRALALYPDYLAARNELGAQYLKLKRVGEAQEQFRAVIKLDSRALQPRLNLGIIAVEQKNFTEAAEHLKQALAINRSEPTAHLYLGIALLGLDRLPEAFEALTEALVLGGPEYAAAHYYIAFVHSRRGEREDAVRELKAYLESSPAGELADHARALLDELK